MKVTTQSRLMLLLTTVVVMIVGGLTFESYLQHRKLNMVLTTGLREGARFFDKLLDLRGESLRAISTEYACWDELVDYVKTADPRWAEENLADGCATFDVDLVWVYRLDGTLVSLTRSPKAQSLVGEDPLAGEGIQGMLGSRRTCHFFQPSRGGFIEIRGSGIHDSGDTAWKSPPRGYLFVGRLWDASFLKELGSLGGGTVRILPSDVFPPEPNAAGGFALTRDLLGADGQRAARLVLMGNSPLLPLIKRASLEEFFLTAVFGLLLLGLLQVTLTLWVSRPLSSISRSLTAEDAGPVEHLRTDGTEFGQLATMIHRFFKQREELAHEAAERKRAEADVRLLNERLEDRVVERTNELEKAKAVLESEIAERKLAEEALRQAKETAEAAARAKSLFLSTMSHEIRTPMNGILALTELALMADLEETTRAHLEIVRGSADSLLAIINDILDFSKLESDRMHLDSVAFDPRQAVSEALAPLSIRASSKGLTLDVAVAPEVPQIVIGDPVRLRQILLNLVGNGVKSTEKGGVDVALDVESRSDEAVTLRLRVRDTGIGIPPEKRGIVFDAFAQADPSITRKFGGTGLGLAITRQLIELMEGSIGFESEVGRGSRFHCTMRMRLAREDPRQLPAAA